MKKFTFLAIFACGLLAITGCSSLQVAENSTLDGQKLVNSGNVDAHIQAQSEGFYFLIFPLFTGSTEKPGNIAIFEDSAKVTAMTNLVTKTSKERKATRTDNIVSRASSTYIPPFFFWKSASVSGNAVK